MHEKYDDLHPAETQLLVEISRALDTADRLQFSVEEGGVVVDGDVLLDGRAERLRMLMGEDREHLGQAGRDWTDEEFRIGADVVAGRRNRAVGRGDLDRADRLAALVCVIAQAEAAAIEGAR